MMCVPIVVAVEERKRIRSVLLVVIPVFMHVLVWKMKPQYGNGVASPSLIWTNSGAAESQAYDVLIPHRAHKLGT